MTYNTYFEVLDKELVVDNEETIIKQEKEAVC